MDLDHRTPNLNKPRLVWGGGWGDKFQKWGVNPSANSKIIVCPPPANCAICRRIHYLPMSINQSKSPEGKAQIEFERSDERRESLGRRKMIHHKHHPHHHIPRYPKYIPWRGNDRKEPPKGNILLTDGWAAEIGLSIHSSESRDDRFCCCLPANFRGMWKEHESGYCMFIVQSSYSMTRRTNFTRFEQEIAPSPSRYPSAFRPFYGGWKSPLTIL